MFPASTGGADIQFRSGIRLSADPVVGRGLDRATPRNRASDHPSTHSIRTISSCRWTENHVRGHHRVVRATEQARAPDAGPYIDESARRWAYGVGRLAPRNKRVFVTRVAVPSAPAHTEPAAARHSG